MISLPPTFGPTSCPLSIDDGRIDAKERKRRAAGLGWSRARQRRDHDRAGLCLPPGIDDRTTSAADRFVIPHPCFRIDRLADCAEQAQRREIVLRHPLIAPANESADRRRRSIKNVDPIFLDDSPEPIRLGPVRRAFVHDDGRAIRERAINDVAVSGDPADIGRAPINIFIADIEDVFGGRINAHQITAGGVQNSFRFSGRSAGVKNVKRMLAVERRGRAVCIHVFQFPMPPNVAAFLHVDVICRRGEKQSRAGQRCRRGARHRHFSLAERCRRGDNRHRR